MGYSKICPAAHQSTSSGLPPVECMWFVTSSLLENLFIATSVYARVRLGRDGVEQEEALRTCQEFLAVAHHE